MPREKSSTAERSLWHRDSGETGRGKSAKDWIRCMRLQLAIEEIPGDHAVFGGRLQQVSCEHTERLSSTDQVPAGLHQSVGRAGVPVPLGLDCPVPFE